MSSNLKGLAAPKAYAFEAVTEMMGVLMSDQGADYLNHFLNFHKNYLNPEPAEDTVLQNFWCSFSSGKIDSKAKGDFTPRAKEAKNNAHENYPELDEQINLHLLKPGESLETIFTKDGKRYQLFPCRFPLATAGMICSVSSDEMVVSGAPIFVRLDFDSELLWFKTTGNQSCCVDVIEAGSFDEIVALNLSVVYELSEFKN